MSFPSSHQSNERLFNNADSFAIAFDEAWKIFKSENINLELNQDEEIKLIFEKIGEHPFLEESPSTAVKVAEFRLRLLNHP